MMNKKKCFIAFLLIFLQDFILIKNQKEFKGAHAVGKIFLKKITGC